MQINYLGENQFRIKTKSGVVNIGREIQIGDFTIEGPGEYEVNGIEVEVIDGIALFHIEEMNITYLDRRKKPLDDHELEKTNQADILFIPIGGGEVFTAKEALAAINQIEPKMVIPTYYQDISEFAHQEGISVENMALLKLNKKDLQEERKIVVLDVST